MKVHFRYFRRLVLRTGVPKIIIAAARAVDREFNYIFGSDLGAGKAGGLRPPTPPCFSGGLRPLDPPKGAPRPWLQRLFAFSRPSHLSGAKMRPTVTQRDAYK